MNVRTFLIGGLCAAAIGLVLATPTHARKWYARVGDFSVEAELEDVREGKAILKRADGKTIQVPLDKLSLADVRYINEQLQAAQAAVGSTATPPKPAATTPATPAPMNSPTASPRPAPQPAPEASPAPPATEPPLAKAGVAGWQVQIDPPARAWKIPEDLQLSVAITGGMGSSLQLPNQASPFALLRVGGTFDKQRQLWDLQTGKQVRSLTIDQHMGGPTALSPDGKFYAITPMHKGKIQLVETATGDASREFALAHWAARVQYVDFAGPNRLVAALDDSKEIAFWDIQQKTKLGGFPSANLPGGVYRYAVSPGGHYLAFADGLAIRLLDSRNAVSAGEITPPPGTKPNDKLQTAALCFSPDGLELAALMNDGGGSALIVWSAADGKQVTDLRFAKPLAQSIPNSRDYQGHPLQWFPDRQSWLVYGRGVVDRQIGGPVWVEPPAPDGHAPGEGRLLLDGQRLAKIGGTKGEQKWEIVKLSPEEIAAGAKMIQAGATAADAALPPLTIADRSAAKSVPLSRQPNQWTYKAGPIPTAKPLLAQPIDVNIKAGDLRVVAVASAAAGKAVVSAATANEPSPSPPPTGREFFRFDLASRRQDAKFSLPFPAEFLDLGPAGNVVLFRILPEGDRLDLWTLGDEKEKHFAGFRPYQGDEVEALKVTWAALVDEQRLLTFNAKGKLILWQLPECYAVYTVDLPPQSTLTLSPDRQYLALYRENEFHLLETASGQCGVTLPSPKLEGGFTATALAFRHDGQAFAALVSSGGMPNLVTWDLNKGGLEKSFQVSRSANAISWTDVGHVALRNEDGSLLLVDLAQETIVWRYTLAFGRHGGFSPDGRHWFAGAENAVDFASLTALELPSPDAQATLKTFPKIDPVIGRGTTVAIEFALAPPPDAGKHAEIQNELKQRFTEALTKAGIPVVPQSALRLKIETIEKPTEDVLNLRSIGPGFGNISVPVSILTAKASFIDGANSVFWESQTTFKTDVGFIEHIPGDVDPKMYIRMKPWRQSVGWLKTLPVPQKIYHKDIADGLGESKLTPAGAVRVKAIQQLPKTQKTGGSGQVAAVFPPSSSG